jgi:ribosomal protein S18 acetylase RimI-like enzyme
MTFIYLHDKAQIEAFVCRVPLLHLYELGDLDDFFWPYTTWYALEEGGRVRQLALLYSAVAIPTLIAVPDPPADAMPDLLRALLPVLPRRFYAHLQTDQAGVFAGDYAVEPRGVLLKMGLRDRSKLDGVDTSAVMPFTEADLPALQTFYRESYPENWFTPRMLQSERYYGMRQGGAIVSVAGVHVYSPRYSAAVLGNVTTHPAWRGRGFARATCARLCKALLQDGIDHIGLNVDESNAPAIATYTRLGFETVASIGAYMLEAKLLTTRSANHP